MDVLGADYKILRPLRIDPGLTGLVHQPGKTWIAAVIDVETTGKNTETDAIIELAVRRFRYDENGRILKIDDCYSWLEHPGRPLSAEITRLTGIQETELIGQAIDDAKAEALLSSADVIIAHNAAFDRKFIDRRLPGVRDKVWLCSCSDVDWQVAGFEDRKLGYLLMQAGWFFGAHRASADVDAVIALLQMVRPDGRTNLADLLATGLQPHVRIQATGARYAVRAALRDRSYKWSPQDQAWSTELPAAQAKAELSWLSDHVYTGPETATRSGPTITEISLAERFA